MHDDVAPYRAGNTLFTGIQREGGGIKGSVGGGGFGGAGRGGCI